MLTYGHINAYEKPNVFINIKDSDRPSPVKKPKIELTEEVKSNVKVNTNPAFQGTGGGEGGEQKGEYHYIHVHINTI